jgi:hypothetical protein
MFIFLIYLMVSYWKFLYYLFFFLSFHASTNIAPMNILLYDPCSNLCELLWDIY